MNPHSYHTQRVTDWKMRAICLLAIFGVLAASALGQNTMEVYIRKVLENFRGQMKTGIPEIKMPVLDPLNVPNIDINIREGVADVQLKIQNFIATGLSTFNVQSVKFDLSTMRLKLNILLPKGDGRAKYDLKGKILRFIPLYGNGNAGFVINDLVIGADAVVDISTGKIHIKDFKVQLTFKQIQVYLENILGGGDLGDLVNQVINGFGKVIFDGQRRNIQNALNGVIRTALNKELSKIDMGKIGYAPVSPADRALFATANANNFVDQILTNARPELKKHDPAVLPDQKWNGFKKRVGIITFRGYARLTDGRCYGLSTLHRAGDVKMSTNIPAGTVSVEGYLGISNLRINYNVYAKFLGIKVRPRLEGSIRGVGVFIKVTQNLKTGKSQLNDFRIVKIDKPKLKVKKLSILGWLITQVLKLAVKPIVKKLRGTIESEVRNLLAQQISKVKIQI